MPLLRIDALEGRTKEEIKALLDATHRAILSSFGVPLRDRYQIYQEHSESNFLMEDTGLGITRTKNRLIVSITSRPRSVESKQAFYANLCHELATCNIAASDVMVSIVTNQDEDWSFGNGEAQFLTGAL